MAVRVAKHQNPPSLASRIECNVMATASHGTRSSTHAGAKMNHPPPLLTSLSLPRQEQTRGPRPACKAWEVQRTATRQALSLVWAQSRGASDLICPDLRSHAHSKTTSSAPRDARSLEHASGLKPAGVLESSRSPPKAALLPAHNGPVTGEPGWHLGKFWHSPAPPRPQTWVAAELVVLRAEHTAEHTAATAATRAEVLLLEAVASPTAVAMALGLMVVTVAVRGKWVPQSSFRCRPSRCG